MKLTKIIPFILPVCWLIISTLLLTIPGTAFPKANWLDKIWADKWVHITMFGLLVFLWCRALWSMNPINPKMDRIFIFIAIAGLLYGTGMEFVQKYWVPFRSFDVGDIIADGLGSAAGLIYSMKRYIKK